MDQELKHFPWSPLLASFIATQAFLIVWLWAKWGQTSAREALILWVGSVIVAVILASLALAMRKLGVHVRKRERERRADGGSTGETRKD